MLQRLVIGLISTYQRYLRGIVPVSCRFSPSCSEYSRQAILKYGCLKGIYIGCLRLLRCHPFCSRRGDDPLV